MKKGTVKVKTLDELVQKMSKSAVIKSFIDKSEKFNRLKKIYGKLSNDDLNKVTLPTNCINWSLNGLSLAIPRNLIFYEDQMNKLKNSLGNWNASAKDKEKFLIALFKSWAFKEGEQNTYNAIKYMREKDMLPTSKNFMNGYIFQNALLDTPDGQVDIDFIKYVSEKKSIAFRRLWNKNDKCFGECLFNTIYQLRRTSDGYNKNNKEAQKQAIKNVLVGKESEEDIYKYFREGLKTFFKEAKDKNNQTAANIDMSQILAQVPKLKAMLENCGMELKFEHNKDNPENSQLTVEEKIKEIEKKEEGRFNNTNLNNNINNNNQTKVSWLKIGFGLVLMFLGIAMLASLFLAPSAVLPVLSNLLLISASIAKFVLPIITLISMFVGIALFVQGLGLEISDIMEKLGIKNNNNIINEINNDKNEIKESKNKNKNNIPIVFRSTSSKESDI